MALPDQRDTPDYPEDGSAAPQADLYLLVQAVLDRIWIIALCVVLASLAAAAYLRRAPRIYQAVATVQVEAEAQKVLNIQQVMQEELRSDSAVNTIVQKLRSRPLLEQVLLTNQLAKIRPLWARLRARARRPIPRRWWAAWRGWSPPPCAVTPDWWM